MSLDSNLMLSNKVQNMAESATIKMAQKARELAATGVDVISLSLGEPDFDTPQYIKDAVVEGLAKGITKYTPVPGLPKLRSAIVDKFKNENGLTYKASQIVVSNGAKQSISNICQAVLNPGDEVIIFAPYWVSYTAIVELCGATPVIISAGVDEDYKISAQQVKGAITSKTKMVLFSSPCNPTGSLFSKTELGAIADVIKENGNILVVSDEIYEYINFVGGHVSIASFEGMQDCTAVVNGFSKGYSMTGWRLGFMAAPQWLASACAKLQGQSTSGAGAFSQYAASFAWTGDQAKRNEMVAAFSKRRTLVLGLLKEIEGMKVNEPQGAFYFFPDISNFFGRSNGVKTIKDANDFCEILLVDAHVATVAGGAFGNPNCFRLSYAASEENLKNAIASMKKVLAAYK